MYPVDFEKCFNMRLFSLIVAVHTAENEPLKGLRLAAVCAAYRQQRLKRRKRNLGAGRSALAARVFCSTPKNQAPAKNEEVLETVFLCFTNARKFSARCRRLS